MSEIIMQLGTAIRAAKAVLPHLDGRNTMTPVLRNAMFDSENKVLVGTDRYTVGVYHLPEPTHWEGDSFLVPHDLLAWVAKIRTAQLVSFKIQPQAYLLKLKADGALVAAELIEHNQVISGATFTQGSGDFPAVLKLVRDFEPAREAKDIPIDLVHLKKLVSGFPADETFVFTTSESNRHHSSGPVRAVNGDFTALIQTNVRYGK